MNFLALALYWFYIKINGQNNRRELGQFNKIGETDLMLAQRQPVQAENSNAWESIGDEKSPANALLPFHGTTSQNVTVKLKEKALLRCLVSWFKADDTRRPITFGLFTITSDRRFSADFNQGTNEWLLTIQDVKPEDEGLYQCVVNSAEAWRMPNDIYLDVQN